MASPAPPNASHLVELLGHFGDEDGRLATLVSELTELSRRVQARIGFGNEGGRREGRPVKACASLEGQGVAWGRVRRVAVTGGHAVAAGGGKGGGEGHEQGSRVKTSRAVLTSRVPHAYLTNWQSSWLL